MSLAVCVLVYSFAVLTLGPRLLARATRGGAAPRLEITAWAAAMASVIGSWLLAAALLGGQLLHAWGHVDTALAGCFLLLRTVTGSAHQGAVQAVLAGVIVGAATGIAALGVRVAVALRRAMRDTRRHGEAALLAAGVSPRGPQGALVVEAAHRSVYCLPGRPRTIVITRGALAALGEAQLAAVLAHERAHLTGRHHVLLAVTGALARILPGARLFTDGAAAIARLTEMSADDAAARCHGGATVVEALLALTAPVRSATRLSSAFAASAVMPAVALGAAGPGVADRVERLLFPPNPAQLRRARGVAAGALLLGPAATALVMLTVYPLCMTVFT